jgi:hypothetical protein
MGIRSSRAGDAMARFLLGFMGGGRRTGTTTTPSVVYTCETGIVSEPEQSKNGRFKSEEEGRSASWRT